MRKKKLLATKKGHGILRDKKGRILRGNPVCNFGGRPRRLSDAYLEALYQTDPDDEGGRNYAQVIADAMVRKAASGFVPAAAEIRAATESGDPSVLYDWKTRARERGLDPEQMLQVFRENLRKELITQKVRQQALTEQMEDVES